MQSRRSFLKTLAASAVALAASVASFKFGQRVAETPALGLPDSDNLGCVTPGSEVQYDYRSYYFMSKDGVALRSAWQMADEQITNTQQQMQARMLNMDRNYAKVIEGLRKQNEA